MKTIANNKVLLQHETERSTPSTGKQSSKPQKSSSKLRSKSETILQALKRKRGASLNELCTITGWQAHSLRGHISGTLRKKNKLNIVSDCTKSGIRRYRLIEECV
jgi:hypothetical protein